MDTALCIIRVLSRMLPAPQTLLGVSLVRFTHPYHGPLPSPPLPPFPPARCVLDQYCYSVRNGSSAAGIMDLNSDAYNMATIQKV